MNHNDVLWSMAAIAAMCAALVMCEGCASWPQTDLNGGPLACFIDQQQCWRDEGFMVRDGGNGPVELHWHASDLPLLIFLQKDAALWDGYLDDAARWWNLRLGSLVFMYFGLSDYEHSEFAQMHGGVFASWAPAENTGSTTTLHYEQETGVLGRCEIFLTGHTETLGDPFIAKRNARHELGHTLGLWHDESPASVMHNVATSDPYDLTDADTALLRAAYKL